jgi:hypothetical protein
MHRRIRVALLIASFVFASIGSSESTDKTRLVVHLDPSTSVRDALRDRRIDAIEIAGYSDNESFRLKANDTTPLTTAVAPGKWKIQAFMMIGDKNYVVEPPAGFEITVPPTAGFDVKVPVQALMVSGRVKGDVPSARVQLNLIPSEGKPGNWGFAVPLDAEGRFFFPLPKEGKWDVNIRTRSRELDALLPDFELGSETNGVEIAVPSGAIAGRVVDAKGNGIEGVTLRATLTRAAKRRPVFANVVSDIDGRFTFDHLAGGTWKIDAADAMVEVVLSPDSRKDDVMLRLSR